jgi:hypothetical protein
MVQLPETEVADAIASGGYSAPGGAGQPIPIRTKDGQLGTIGVSELADAVNKHGASVVSTDEYQRALEDHQNEQAEHNALEARHEAHNTVASKATSLATGALDTGTFGLGPGLIESQLKPDVSKYIQESEAEHPNYHTAGQAAGIIAPIAADLATGGLATPGLMAGEAGSVARIAGRGALDAIAAPTRVLGAAGDVTEAGLRSILGSPATTVAGRLAQKGITAVGRGATEGGLIGLASETGQELKEDKGLSADKILASGQHNALFGGALSLGGAAVGSAVTGTSRWANSRLETAANDYFKKFAGAEPTNRSPTYREMIDSNKLQNVRQTMEKAGVIGPARSLEDVLEGTKTHWDAANKEYTNSLKAIDPLINVAGDVSTNPKADEIFNILDGVLKDKKFSRALDKIEDVNGVQVTKNLVNIALDKIPVTLKEQVERTPAEQALYQNSKEFQKSQGFLDWAKQGFKGTPDEVKFQMVEKPSSLGNITEANREQLKDVPISLTNAADISNSLGELGKQTRIPEVGNAIMEVRQKFNDHIYDSIKKSLKKLGGGDPAHEAFKTFEKASDKLDPWNQALEITRSALRAPKGTPESIANVGLPTLTAAGGLALHGNFPAAAGALIAGAAKKSIKNYVNSPDGALTASLVTSRLSNWSKIEAASTHIDDVMSKIVRATVQGSKVYEYSHPVNHPEDFETRAKSVMKIASDPQSTIDMHRDHTGWIGQEDPGLQDKIQARALGQVTYLAQQLPKTASADPSSLTPKTARTFDASDLAKDHFNQCYEAVNIPLKTLGKLQDGRMTSTEIEAFKATHPDMYKECVSKFKDELEKADKPLSLAQEQNLKTFLGMPQETMSMQMILSAPQTVAPSGKGRGGGKAPKAHATKTSFDEGFGKTRHLKGS